MANTKSSKPADLATTCRELLAALDKFYGKSQQDLPPQVRGPPAAGVLPSRTTWHACSITTIHTIYVMYSLSNIYVHTYHTHFI